MNTQQQSMVVEDRIHPGASNVEPADGCTAVDGIARSAAASQHMGMNEVNGSPQSFFYQRRLSVYSGSMQDRTVYGRARALPVSLQ